jgi:hypothetical protein
MHAYRSLESREQLTRALLKELERSRNFVKRSMWCQDAEENIWTAAKGEARIGKLHSEDNHN